MKTKKIVAALLSACTVCSGFTLADTKVEAASSLQGESIYQIMVDRFYDGDPSNNATGEAFRNTEWNSDDFRYMHGGDWQGIIDKIDYIKGMGYTAVWISPVADPQLWGMPDGNGKQWPTAYHGYNVYDPYRASRYFGAKDREESEAKLKELADVCHKNGLKVILDVVPNHVGDYLQGVGGNAHYISNKNLKPGTQTKPVAPFDNKDWYHNQGDINWDNEHPHTTDKTAYIECHDLGGLDDIDLDNSRAKWAIYDSIKYFVDLTHADAVRVDAAKCMKPSDIHELERYLGVTSFGENFDMCPSFVSQWVGSNGENGMLDFPLFQAVVNDFAYGQNFNNTSETSVQAVFDQDYYYGDNVNEMVTFIDNHDRNRFLTEAGGNVKKMQNALTFIYTCRGVPVVFQGTEQNIGNKNNEKISGIADTWNRWSMVEKDYNGKVVADHFDTSKDTYKLIAKLNKLRQDNPALQFGKQREMWTSEHLYAFSRRIDKGENEGEEVICAFNNSDSEKSANMSIRAESSIEPGDILVNVDNCNDTLKVSKDGKINVKVPGNSNKIYVLKEKGGDEQETVQVTFKIDNAYTVWGQNVYIVGDCDELGNWDTDLAVGPAECPNYPEWEYTVELPANTKIEFKAIKKDENGNVEWQSGSNRVISVGESDMLYEFSF